MGHQPIPRVMPPPDRESFHLGRAKHLYVTGALTLEQFEEAVEHVLRGGHLRQDGTPARLWEPEWLPSRDPAHPRFWLS